jgi:hypothetical protein
MVRRKQGPPPIETQEPNSILATEARPKRKMNDVGLPQQGENCNVSEDENEIGDHKKKSDRGDCSYRVRRNRHWVVVCSHTASTSSPPFHDGAAVRLADMIVALNSAKRRQSALQHVEAAAIQ